MAKIEIGQNTRKRVHGVNMAIIGPVERGVYRCQIKSDDLAEIGSFQRSITIPSLHRTLISSQCCHIQKFCLFWHFYYISFIFSFFFRNILLIKWCLGWVTGILTSIWHKLYVCVRIKRYHVVDHRKGDIGQNRKKSQKCRKRLFDGNVKKGPSSFKNSWFHIKMMYFHPLPAKNSRW